MPWLYFWGSNPALLPAAIELMALLSPVGHHPVGSTVSRQTLERHGYSPLGDYSELINASKQKIAQSAS